MLVDDTGCEAKHRPRAEELGAFDEGEEALEAEDENPDDAAVEKTVTGVALNLLCICHAHFWGPCEEPTSNLFSITLSCQITCNCYIADRFKAGWFINHR